MNCTHPVRRLVESVDRKGFILCHQCGGYFKLIRWGTQPCPHGNVADPLVCCERDDEREFREVVFDRIEELWNLCTMAVPGDKERFSSWVQEFKDKMQSARKRFL